MFIHRRLSVRCERERDSQAREKLKNEKENFFDDQCNNKTGKKNNSWSTITYRMALAVFCRSPAAYEALRSFGVLQLPSLNMLRNKSAKYHDKPVCNRLLILGLF
jgi:hypothetical protein